MPVNVLIVDDHPLFRKGLRAIIKSNSNYNIIGEAIDGIEAIALVKKKEPDLIIMDITMPNINGIEATIEILKILPKTKILALSIHTGKQFVKGMLKAGAVGYLIKDSAPEELLIAMDKIVNNEMYLCSAVTSAALSPDNDLDHEKFVVLNTKLHRPAIADDYVKRKEIIKYLDANFDKPLTLISAPAGYGKSIVASQWLEHTSCLHSWVSLDQEHSNLRMFLIYIHAAIEKIFPGSLDKIDGILNANELPPISIIAHTFINEVDLIEHDFILVLDDYNLIKDLQIHDFIDEILRFPPEHLHLLIIARKDPPLNLSILRINGRMNEIRMNNLCFSEPEVKELYKKILNVQISNQSVDNLLKKTEGWVVGLRLASVKISDARNADTFIKSVKNDDQLVSDFLISEVLSKQPENFKKLLVITSLLNRFNVELLDVVFEKHTSDHKDVFSGSAFINEVINSNLFVISLDDAKTWFRYHHLFQGILHKQLSDFYSQKQIFEFHEKISAWFQKEGFVGEAIEHALKANSNKKAIAIIENEWVKVTNEFNWRVLESWLTYLPNMLVNTSISLLLMKAWIAQAKNKMQELSEIIQRIIQLKADLSAVDKGFLAFFKGILNYYEGQADVAMKYFKEAIKLIPKQYLLIRSDIDFFGSLVGQMKGEPEISILPNNNNNKSSLFSKYGNSLNGSRKLVQEITIEMLEADLPKVQHKMIAYFNQKRNVNNSNSLGEYFKGSRNYWASELTIAITEFENLINNRYYLNNRSIIDSFIGLALSQHYLNKPQEALESIKQMMAFAEEINEPEITKFAKSGQARIALLQRNVGGVKNWLNTTMQYDLKVNTAFWIDDPSITYCRVLIFKGDEESLKKSLELLDIYMRFADTIHNKVRKIEILVLKSVVNTKLDNKSEGLLNIYNALELVTPGGFVQLFVEFGDEILELLLKLKAKKQHLKIIDVIIGIVERKNSIFNSAKSKKQEGLKVVRKTDLDEIISSREVEVLNLVAKGLRNKEIAEILFVSDDTIKKHLYHIFQKMEVSNRTGLVSKAKELGMISN